MRNCLVSWLSVFWIRKFAFNTVQCLFGLFYYEFYINSKSVLDAVTRPYGAHFAFEITLLRAIMLTLLLVCALPTARTAFIFFRATHLKTANAPSSLKRREFDVFKPHKYTVSCGDPVMVLCRF